VAGMLSGSIKAEKKHQAHRNRQGLGQSEQPDFSMRKGRCSR
jgi:hypothetical protein